MRKQKTSLFNYLMITYYDPLAVDARIHGFFRAKNKKDAKKTAHEIWKSQPKKRRWMVVTNENGTEIVNHSNHGNKDN